MDGGGSVDGRGSEMEREEEHEDEMEAVTDTEKSREVHAEAYIDGDR